MTHRPDRGHRDRIKTQEKKGRRSEFETLDLPPEVMAGIDRLEFVEMTPIQREALPITLKGRDLFGQAQTGTGKTAAFLITIFSRMLNSTDDRKEPGALILSPTRELAVQTYKEAQGLGWKSGLRCGVFYGGQDYRKQELTLESGIDIAIGTPGRLLDFIRRDRLRLGRIRFLVIDEADRLMDLGFKDELNAILRRLPPVSERQSMLFSATIDGETRRLARIFMNSPETVEIRPENLMPEGIEEMVYHVEREFKFRTLLTLLGKEEVPRGMIFANTKVVAGFIVEKLARNGIPASLLTGDLQQNQRMRVLDEFRAGKTALLVCSDVASRGLHIDDVSHIFNYDVPFDSEDYVHRVGRTARAGKTGKAYTLACDEYVYNLPPIEAYVKRRLPFAIVEPEKLAPDASEDFDFSAYKRHLRSRRMTRGDSSGRQAGRDKPRSKSRPRPSGFRRR